MPAKRARAQRRRTPTAVGPTFSDVDFAAENFSRIAVNSSPDVRRRRAEIEKAVKKVAQGMGELTSGKKKK